MRYRKLREEVDMHSRRDRMVSEEEDIQSMRDTVES
jgi:hypothetical protein